jgi:hypothetical protein
MPHDILIPLVEDDDPDVRRAVAENPNTPLDILAVLAEDVDAEVAKAALQRFGSEIEKRKKTP